jgi:PAS domain S-box-containing protein
MLGLSEDDLCKLSLLDITHEDDRERNRELFIELHEGKEKVGQTEARFRRKQGNAIWVNLHISLVPRAGSVPECVITIAEDVTQRKQAEEGLRQYERVVEGLQELIVVIDRDYRYRIANRAFLNYRGLEREQLIGKLVPDLLNPGVLESVAKQKLDECFAGNVVKYELRYAYPGKGERDLFISYFPMESATGIEGVA